MKLRGDCSEITWFVKSATNYYLKVDCVSQIYFHGYMLMRGTTVYTIY